MVYNKKRRKTKRRKGGLTVAEKTGKGVGELSQGIEKFKEESQKFAQWSKETGEQASDEFKKEKKGSLGEQMSSAIPVVTGGKRRRRRKTKRKRRKTKRKRRKTKRKRRKSRKKGRKKKKTFLCPYKKHYCKH